MKVLAVIGFFLCLCYEANGQCVAPIYSDVLYVPVPDNETGLFQGDILITEDQMRDMRRSAYNVLPKNSPRRWGTGRGAVVPYEMAGTYTAWQKRNIIVSLNALSQRSGYCVRFVPRTTERDYIHAYRGKGCSSNIGRIGGRQTISLGDGCMLRGIIQHEFLHALGFWHEQSRGDRDSYVKVNWNNIMRDQNAGIVSQFYGPEFSGPEFALACGITSWN